MGANWTNPTVNSDYVDFVDEVKSRDEDVATLFNDGAATNIPTNSVKYLRASDKFQYWSGSAFVDLVLSIAGGGTGASTTGGARTSLGLGSMATQDNTAVNITGGTIARVALPAAVGYLDEIESVSAAWNFQVGIAVNNGTPSTWGIVIPDATPAVTTNALYSVSSALYFNGAILAVGGSISGTTGTVAKFASSSTIGDSIITESGTVITVSNTVNAITGFQVNGAVQQNVVSGATPTFTGTNFTGIPAANVLAGSFGTGAFTFSTQVTGGSFVATAGYVTDGANRVHVAGSSGGGYILAQGADATTLGSLNIYLTESDGGSLTTAGTFSSSGLAWGGGSAISSSSNVAVLNAANVFTNANPMAVTPTSGTSFGYVSFNNTGGTTFIGANGSGATDFFSTGTAYATVIACGFWPSY
jgi:hypothetical protein